MRIREYPNNCCPVALHIVSGLPEEVVLEACFRNGFHKKGESGMYQSEWFRAATELGLLLEHVTTTLVAAKGTWPRQRYNMTLGEFTKQYPTGVYLVHVHGHLLVVIDGVIRDPNVGLRRARRQVLCAHHVANAQVTPVRPRRIPRDPLVTFIRTPFAAHSSGGLHLEHYRTAYSYWFNEQGKQPTRWSDLAAHSTLTRRDFRVDLAQGNIQVVEEE